MHYSSCAAWVILFRQPGMVVTTHTVRSPPPSKWHLTSKACLAKSHTAPVCLTSLTAINPAKLKNDPAPQESDFSSNSNLIRSARSSDSTIAHKTSNSCPCIRGIPWLLNCIAVFGTHWNVANKLPRGPMFPPSVNCFCPAQRQEPTATEALLSPARTDSTTNNVWEKAWRYSICMHNMLRS